MNNTKKTIKPLAMIVSLSYLLATALPMQVMADPAEFILDTESAADDDLMNEALVMQNKAELTVFIDGEWAPDYLKFTAAVKLLK